MYLAFELQVDANTLEQDTRPAEGSELQIIFPWFPQVLIYTHEEKV